MSKIVFMAFVVFVIFSCSKPIYTGPCDQVIIESSSDFNNGPFDVSTEINSIVWNGNCLDFSITYGGGCSDHLLEVVTDGSIVKTDPPILNLAIKHNNTDQCEALVTETISYGLGDNTFLNDEEVIILNFVNPEFSYTLEK